MSGTLYGIGVGPGDPELLTLKAHRIISAARIIAYPAPDTGPSFARAIAAEYFPDGAVEIPIIVPMRRDRYPAKEIYDKAANDLSTHLDAGKDVVVLCEGDPFFYGSFMYLFERLAGTYRSEVVPGVSSMMACASILGRPLAARNDILSVLPAPMSEEALEKNLAGAQAAAIIKIGRHFDKVKRVLTKTGLLERAGYVERATLPNQVAGRLVDVDPSRAPYFSMILVYKGEEPWTLAPRS
ncbi:MAG: precorrin-2 C(20)-methyltransferase [Stappiaceae bacterium]